MHGSVNLPRSHGSVMGLCFNHPYVLQPCLRLMGLGLRHRWKESTLSLYAAGNRMGQNFFVRLNACSSSGYYRPKNACMFFFTFLCWWCFKGKTPITKPEWRLRGCVGFTTQISPLKNIKKTWNKNPGQVMAGNWQCCQEKNIYKSRCCWVPGQCGQCFFKGVWFLRTTCILYIIRCIGI